jgi:hypothetical protein
VHIPESVGSTRDEFLCGYTELHRWVCNDSACMGTKSVHIFMVSLHMHVCDSFTHVCQCTHISMHVCACVCIYLQAWGPGMCNCALMGRKASPRLCRGQGGGEELGC